MAGIIKTSINLSMIPKDRIIVGRKGNIFRLQLQLMMNQINLVIKDLWLLINQRKSVKLKHQKLT